MTESDRTVNLRTNDIFFKTGSSQLLLIKSFLLQTNLAISMVLRSAGRSL